MLRKTLSIIIVLSAVMLGASPANPCIIGMSVLGGVDEAPKMSCEDIMATSYNGGCNGAPFNCFK